MNWDALGATGEIVGALVVVASLIYLSMQVRQNTAAVRSSIRATFLEGIQTVNGFVLEHNKIWNKAAFENEMLEGEELTKYITMVHSYLNVCETLYSEYLSGNVEEEFWQGKVRQLEWTFRQPSGDLAWRNYTFLFDSRFVGYVNENIYYPLKNETSDT
jgi:hypothetical protein